MKTFGFFHCLVVAVLALAMLAAIVISAHTMASFAADLRKLSTPTPIPTPRPYIATPAALRMLI